MHMVYNSANYVVVQFDVPIGNAGPPLINAAGEPLTRGGFELVDKFARKEIFLEGAMAQSFKEGVEALIQTQPSEDDMDAFIARFASLMQQPVVLH